MRVLRPDIIVTQGDWAKWGVKAIAKIQQPIDDFACVIQFDGRDLFWLHTYHPAAFGKFNAQRARGKGWERYSENIREFIDKTGRFA